MANISSHRSKLAPVLAAAAILIAANAWPQSKMEIRTSAFTPGGSIPAQYTCSGENTSPPLSISGVPAGAKTLALIVDDPDAPSGTFVHWVVYNLPPAIKQIEAAVKPGTSMAGGGMQGRNDFGGDGYGGPCPPPGAPHHYRFRLFALNSKISPESPKGSAIEQAMQPHIVASAETTGIFGR